MLWWSYVKNQKSPCRNRGQIIMRKKSAGQLISHTPQHIRLSDEIQHWLQVSGIQKRGKNRKFKFDPIGNYTKKLDTLFGSTFWTRKISKRVLSPYRNVHFSFRSERVRRVQKKKNPTTTRKNVKLVNVQRKKIKREPTPYRIPPTRTLYTCTQQHVLSTTGQS